MSFDEVRDYLSDSGLQEPGGSKALPLPPHRVMWEVGHIAPRQLHGQVKGSCQAPHFLVIHRIEPGEEPIQYRRHAIGGVTRVMAHGNCCPIQRRLACLGRQGRDYWIVTAREVRNRGFLERLRCRRRTRRGHIKHGLELRKEELEILKGKGSPRHPSG